MHEVCFIPSCASDVLQIHHCLVECNVVCIDSANLSDTIHSDTCLLLFTSITEAFNDGDFKVFEIVPCCSCIILIHFKPNLGFIDEVCTSIHHCVFCIQGHVSNHKTFLDTINPFSDRHSVLAATIPFWLWYLQPFNCRYCVCCRRGCWCRSLSPVQGS